MTLWVLFPDEMADLTSLGVDVDIMGFCGKMKSGGLWLTVIFPEFAPRRIPARLTLKATILSPKVAKMTPVWA